jgi:hypothetical protein
MASESQRRNVKEFWLPSELSESFNVDVLCDAYGAVTLRLLPFVLVRTYGGTAILILLESPNFMHALTLRSHE